MTKHTYEACYCSTDWTGAETLHYVDLWYRQQLGYIPETIDGMGVVTCDNQDHCDYVANWYDEQERDENVATIIKSEGDCGYRTYRDMGCSVYWVEIDEIDEYGETIGTDIYFPDGFEEWVNEHFRWDYRLHKACWR